VKHAMKENNTPELSQELVEYYKLARERPELFSQTGELEIILDEKQILSYEKQHVGKKIGVLYKSDYNMLVVDLVKNSASTFAYERLVPTSKGVSVVVMPRYHDKYILLKQYRHAMRDYQIAFPRGYGEDNTSASDNAVKELREEIGATVSSTMILGNVIANSGISGDKTAIIACEVENYDKTKREEGTVEILELTSEQLKEKTKDNTITDAYTLSALALETFSRTN
jgi:ADP-ribose pyrophosphatase